MRATPSASFPASRRWHRIAVAAVFTGVLAACGGGGDTGGTAGTAAAPEDNRKVALADVATPLSDLQALIYIASYDDLILAFGPNPDAGRAHYASRAAIERRVLSFDPLNYVATHSDLIAAFGVNSLPATRHYITFGFREKRSRGSFDALAYIATYPDLIAAFNADTIGATRHFITTGFAQGRRPSFDGLLYTASYPAELIPQLGGDDRAALLAYITAYPLGRRATFDPVAYLNRYSDLKAAFGNDTHAALFHFITAGFREGRTDGSVVTTPTTPTTPTDPTTPTTPTGPAAAIVDAFFVTGSVGFRVDAEGKVGRTTNGGSTWTVVGSVPVTGNTLRVVFGSATQGWVVVPAPAGSPPRVFRTADAGATFTEQTLPTPAASAFPFNKLRAIDGNTLIITNSAALDGSATPNPNDPRQIIVTRDGGQIWLIRNVDPVHITATGVLWSLSGGQVLKSTNLGQGVTPTTLDASATLLRVSFIDDNTGLVVGRTATETFAVWRTTDGGANWTKLNARGLPTDASCRNATEHRLVLGSTDSATFSVSGGTACTGNFRSLDGGTSWSAG
jgi:photosystem II stability/assembly factor-like uncharacterized protein